MFRVRLAGLNGSFSANLPALRVRKTRNMKPYCLCRSVVSVSPTFALAATLLACSAPSQNPSVATGAHASAQAVEQCSIFGVMACSAVTLLSGEGGAASTCSPYRASSGTRVETCGSEAKATQAKSVTTKANTHTVRLSWSDNSNNEEGFVVERCDQVRHSGKARAKPFPALASGSVSEPLPLISRATRITELC